MIIKYIMESLFTHGNMFKKQETYRNNGNEENYKINIICISGMDDPRGVNWYMQNYVLAIMINNIEMELV